MTSPLLPAVFSSAARDALVQIHVIPPQQRCYFRSAAVKVNVAANAASRADQRFPAAGSCGFVPRCWVLTDTWGGDRQSVPGKGAHGVGLQPLAC